MLVAIRGGSRPLQSAIGMRGTARARLRLQRPFRGICATAPCCRRPKRPVAAWVRSKVSPEMAQSRNGRRQRCSQGGAQCASGVRGSGWQHLFPVGPSGGLNGEGAFPTRHRQPEGKSSCGLTGRLSPDSVRINFRTDRRRSSCVRNLAQISRRPLDRVIGRPDRIPPSLPMHDVLCSVHAPISGGQELRA